MNGLPTIYRRIGNVVFCKNDSWHGCIDLLQNRVHLCHKCSLAQKGKAITSLLRNFASFFYITVSGYQRPSAGHDEVCSFPAKLGTGGMGSGATSKKFDLNDRVCPSVFNPRRACAARVTVVVSFVKISLIVPQKILLT